ncbi:MAG TPA: hypothetical protein VNR61_19995 [Niallia sp.]|nr:hypothetical protein [Niallia sp.]
MKYLGYLLYFIIATTIFYYVTEFVSNQKDGSAGLYIGNGIRALLLLFTGYLVAIKVKKTNR